MDLGRKEAADSLEVQALEITLQRKYEREYLCHYFPIIAEKTTVNWLAIHRVMVKMVEKGDCASLEWLLGRYDVNLQVQDHITQQTLVHIAARYGHLEMVKMLSKRGVPLDAMDKNGITALLEAVMEKHQDVVRFLLDHGVEIQEGTCDIAISSGWDIEGLCTILARGKQG